MAHARTSYVCLPCRASYKQPYGGDHDRRCPRCAQLCFTPTYASWAVTAPAKLDRAGYRPLRTRRPQHA